MSQDRQLSRRQPSQSIDLKHHGDHVHFSLVQDHGRLAPQDLRLKLDPTTLLIAKDTPARNK